MSHVTREMKRLLGKAVHGRGMIADGDHVLAAVSGGKDSFSLLWLLQERLRRIPITYRVTAVHIDLGFPIDSGTPMAAFLESHGFNHRIIRSDIGPRAHGPENRENPCFLCSRLRRKLLFQAAAELGCNKIAFAHHKDDLIETFFINVFYGASISTMKPVQEFFEGKLTLIRPLYLLDEHTIRRYAEEMAWPIIDVQCPSAGHSKRAEIKHLLQALYHSNRKIKGNVFHALHNVRMDYMP